MEDGRGVDELGGLLELAGTEVGQGQTVAGLEPGDRPGGQVLGSQPLNVDGQLVGLQPVVGVGKVAEQLVTGGLREGLSSRGARPARWSRRPGRGRRA